MIAINVSQLLKQPVGTSRDLKFADPLAELSPEIEIAEPVQGHARLLRTSRGILVTSSYRTVVRQACGRCLEPSLCAVDGESTDEFLPRVDVYTGHPLEEQAESSELSIDERHVLNLTEVIRQDLVTRLPLQPLCSVDCPGLCGACGRELRGHQACGEQAVEAGSPFAGLAKLLGDEAFDQASSGPRGS